MRTGDAAGKGCYERPTKKMEKRRHNSQVDSERERKNASQQYQLRERKGGLVEGGGKKRKEEEKN